jgi:TPR repeat protein
MTRLLRSLMLALLLIMGVFVPVQAQTLEQSIAALDRKDFSAAYAGFRKLAEQGNSSAQFYLGEMYRVGQGVHKDEQQSAAWFSKSAEQGNPDAQRKLGLMYILGTGVPQDEQQAVAWFRKAAERGDAVAQHAIGMMYNSGQGVPKDRQQALAWFSKAAEQGNPDAQLQMGVMLKNGEGVPKDEAQAVVWLRKAAERGNAVAQYLIGVNYYFGQSVPKDEQVAYFWLLLASAQGYKSAVKARDLAEQGLSPEQRTATQAAARDWRPKSATHNSNVPGGSTADAGGSNRDPGRQAPASAQPDSTGSGFRVAVGAVVTNHHVIDGCGRLRVNGVSAQVRGSDPRSDLASLAVTLPGPSVRLRTQRAAVGESVAVAGYPLRGLLSGLNMTTGTLSSLSGLGGDTRYLQITAPVQPGNSGGPMLDSAGNLMGVVVSKLDAIKLAKITGDIPQNVNFAINVNVLRSFLDANSVDYDSANSDKPLPPTAIAEKAKGFTVLVECWK